MENKKFEELIDLIINENEEKARELFHEIVVEKSREIYESIMDEEMQGSMEEGDSVGGMLDEIEAEETMSEEDDAAAEFDDEAEEAGDDLTKDLEGDHDMGEGDVEDKVDDLEDRIVDVEDELDKLLAMMGGGDEGGEEVEVAAGDEEMMEAADDEEDVTEAKEDDEEAVEESEEKLEEAVKLEKVSVTHGDNGAYTKSPALHEPKVKTAGVKPVKFSGDSEAVPTGPKGPSNEYSKKEGNLPGADKFKNAPGHKGMKLDNAPKPKHGDNGSNNKSPVAKG